MKNPSDFQTIKHRAEKGDPKAQVTLGKCYQYQRGVSQDLTLARTWYTKAAAQGNTEAQVRLARVYNNGKGVAKNLKKAEEWINKACQSQSEGDWVCYARGYRYAEGLGCPIDYPKALQHFKQTPTLDATQTYVGWMYCEGKGVIQNYQEGLKWYHKAAAQGYTHAQSGIGYMYCEGKGVIQNYQKGLDWFQKAAAQGNAYAQTNIGWMYDQGNGVIQNYQKALKWYHKAAAQGDATAQNIIGNMYEKGKGVKQDYQQAFKWYYKAAVQGDVEAQYILGRIYKTGTGVVQNYQKALKWYRQAAAQGNARAQNSIGDMYEEGQGVIQNYQEALKWYHKAAAQGRALAQTNIGYMYWHGHGVVQDYMEAVKWFRKAAQQGSARARSNLAIAFENNHAKPLSAQEAIDCYSACLKYKPNAHKIKQRLEAALLMRAAEQQSQMRTQAALQKDQSQDALRTQQVRSYIQSASNNNNNNDHLVTPSAPGLHTMGLVYPPLSDDNNNHHHHHHHNNDADTITPSAPGLHTMGLIYPPLSDDNNNNNTDPTVTDIPGAELIFGQLLGAGGLGKVKRGQWKARTVAIKYLHSHLRNEETRQQFDKEITLLSTLDNPHIVHVLGKSQHGNKLCMVMEFVPRTLDSFLQNHDNDISRERKRRFALDTAQGLKYLHGKGVLHLDLKTPNVLLTDDLCCKLSDFGISKALASDTRTHVSTMTKMGTPGYMAPEVITASDGVKYTKSVDIYSLGVILWEIETRQVPYAQFNDPIQVAMHVVKGNREKIPQSTPSQYKELIENCWAQRREERPKIAEVVVKLKRLANGANSDETFQSELTPDGKNNNNNNINTP